MMNPHPQYQAVGNNNAPPNPLQPPTDVNGHNANYAPPNGTDVAQKMHNMSLNGPQGFPTGQLPPGQMPPNYGGQQNFPPNRPPGSQGQFPPQQKPMPPSSTPSGDFQPQSQQFQKPPTSQGPPSLGPPGQMLQQRPGMPGQPGMIPQPGQPPNQSGMPPSQQGLPPNQQGLPPSQQGLPPQPNMSVNQAGQPNQQPSHPGMPPQPNIPMSQPGTAPSQGQRIPQMPGQGFPNQPNFPGQPNQGLPPQRPGQPPQPGQISGLPPQPQMPGFQQPGMPSHQQPGQRQPMPGQGPPQGQMQGPPGQNQPSMPPMPGQNQQYGMPPMPGQNQQSGMPGMPPMPGQNQPNMPPMPGQNQQPGMTPMSSHNQPGMPPMPGQNQQGMPPMPSHNQQPGMPPMPGQKQPGMPPMPNQNQQSGMHPMPGQNHQNQQPGMPPMPSHNQPGMPPMQSHNQPGIPPLAGQMQPPGQPGMQQGLPPQPGMQPGYNQFQSNLPHMPPMAQRYPGAPPQPGMPPAGPNAGFQGMPPQPGQQQFPNQQPPASGYPPQFGGQFPAQQPSYPNPQYQQPKRLDPDQMPSPIQVMADDQASRGGVFITNEKGAVPPLVTTDFTVEDRGNASPRYMRSSMYSIPVTGDLLKQTAMPFCLVISPMAETYGPEPEPPLLDFAALTGSPTMGPVRCCRCKAYMCPNMKFIDAGRHFKCAFCKATTEVPMEYTQYVNSMQQYGRVAAEMGLGAYEIVATKEYCRNNTLPNPPAIVFCIDVSYNAVKNGLLQTVCENLLDILQALPKDEATGKSWTRVGFITYSSTVHFYNIKGTLAQPQMLSVGDVGDMFVPLLEGFLCTPEDSGDVLMQLLELLPKMFADNKETETVLLPAVQAGYEALKAADTSGQLMVFHTTLPSYNAPGKLTNREDRKLLGTDKEKQILAPQNTSYNELGQLCSAAGVCVEMFVCNNAYVDTATIGQLPRLTGGQIHKYTYFTAEIDGPRLIADAVRVASRPTAHDAVMRVRTSTGVRATEFIGHLFMSNTTDVELAAIDADKAIGIEIKHDDKLTAEDGVYIQAALLYTHRSGQRRLRVLNLALNVAHQLADVYRSMELDTTVNYLTKQAVWALREHPPRQVREGLSQRCCKSLAAYRRHCASPSSAGQLVLPESMKLLPLYTSCILRSEAVGGGPDLTCDDRSCAMYRTLTADVSTSVVYTYPRLLPLHNVPDLPHVAALRASVDKMTDQGVYLLENGVHMLIWVGSQASPEFCRDVFGVTSPQQIDTQVCELPELSNPVSEAVRAVIEDARARRRVAMRLTVMRQHDKLEVVLRQFLVEDRGVDGSASYVDFLCHVHKEIRALL